MIKCVIVDDEQHSIDILIHHVSKIDSLKIVLATTDVRAAINLISAGDIDLAFLDVQMPEISGIEMIHAINGKCKVILTTAYEKYAMQGFELNVVDFLLKPISFPRLIRSVQKVQELITNSSKSGNEREFIYVKTGNKYKIDQIILDEIEYIESIKNYAQLYHAGKKTLIYISLRDLEAQLPASKFIRVSKSYIVPYSRIEGVVGNRINLKNSNVEISIGETYRASFWEKIRTKIVE